jgi:hypothetical protein
MAALDELVPAAVKSLKAHLGDGDPTAWRAALTVFEQAFGRPADVPEEDVDVDGAFDVHSLTRTQRARLIARVLENHPEFAESVRGQNRHER